MAATHAVPAPADVAAAAPPAPAPAQDVSAAATAAPPHANGVELVSLRVTLGPKVLFLALRENDRGRFLKLSNNAGAHTARAKIIVPESGIADLREAVASVARKDRELGDEEEVPPSSAPKDSAAQAAEVPTVAGGSGAAASTPGKEAGDESSKPAPAVPLISERLFVRGRRFFLDVLANERGRYCKLSAIEPYGRRASVIFPASGLEAVVEAIDEIVAQAPPSRDGPAHEPNGAGLTPSNNKTRRELQVDAKRVVVEAGANRRGSYVRVLDGYSNGAVTLPFGALPEFISSLQEVLDAGEPAPVSDDVVKVNGKSGAGGD